MSGRQRLSGDENQKHNQSPSGSSKSEGISGLALLQQYADNGDVDAQQFVSGPGGPDRAAVGVIRSRNVAHVGAAPGMGLGLPAQLGGMFSQSHAQPQPKGVQNLPRQDAMETFQFALLPQKRQQMHTPAPKQTQELELPSQLPSTLMFSGMAFDDSEEIEEMGWESDPDDARPPRLEIFDRGCKTTLVSSQLADEVNDRLQTSLAIFQSRHSKQIEIVRHGETWQTNVEYIYKYQSASISIRILETEKAETAIMFNRTKGEGSVFQRFYRLFCQELRGQLPDVKGLDGNAEPQIAEVTFNTDGLVVKPQDIQHTLDSHLKLLGSHHNRCIEPQREVTGALVQIVASNPQECVGAANKTAHLAHAVCSTMNECCGDIEVVHNCARILNILLGDGGADCKQLYRWLHSGHSSKPAFEIAAENLAQTLESGEADTIAPMMCSDLCTLLDLLLKNYKCAGAELPEKAMAALMNALTLQVPDRFKTIQSDCTRLVQEAY